MSSTENDLQIEAAGKNAVEAFEFIHKLYQSVNKLLRKIDADFERPEGSGNFVHQTKGQHVVYYSANDTYGWAPSSFFRVFVSKDFPDRLYSVEIHFNRDYQKDGQPKIVFGRHDYEPGHLPHKYENWWLNQRRWATRNWKASHSFTLDDRDGYLYSVKNPENDRPAHAYFIGAVFKSDLLFTVKGAAVKRLIVDSFDELNLLFLHPVKPDSQA